MSDLHGISYQQICRVIDSIHTIFNHGRYPSARRIGKELNRKSGINDRELIVRKSEFERLNIVLYPNNSY